MIRDRTARKKKRNPGRYLVVLAVVIVTFGVVNSGRGILQIIQLSRMKATEQEARDAAVGKRNALQEEVTRLLSDSLYIEEIARREYGMVRPGEEVYNITLPDTAAGTGKNVGRE